ncbi:uncharacterized protein AB675_5448 [Cyphellophora attinorum]|uniref:Uncharacterized protein n=1 Tax=Cyphellophora attinorum TaxID=1664694 RepID=A0A0N1H6X5_9EURO|nr:uncharacterized protein AB675_5448 [Phialophora attinorum]KPI41970.1 hypothetical protein AB675_5448 [Phialophora attinorum]
MALLRVTIVLKELGLSYEEVLIDLNGPRPDWYLRINPRGLVPSLHVKGDGVDEFLVESGPIVDFLIELYPSRLTPQDGTPLEKAVARWRQRFFVDTFFSKVVPLLFKIGGIGDRDAQLKIVDEVVGHTTKELEPSLKDVAPHFGGSKTLTVVEAMCMPFLILAEDMCDDVIWPVALLEQLSGLPNFGKWMEAGCRHSSVLYKVEREPRKAFVREKLSEVRKKYAEKVETGRK